MKPISYPPFIVFFDSLAVFLFILMMNQNETITIKLTNDKLFHGAELFYKKDNYYYPVTGSKQKKRNESKYFLPCGQSNKCKAVRRDFGNAYVLLPQETFTEIARLALTAADCKGLIFTLDLKGKLNYIDAASKNRCLSTVGGFDDQVKEYQKTQYANN